MMLSGNGSFLQCVLILPIFSFLAMSNSPTAEEMIDAVTLAIQKEKTSSEQQNLEDLSALPFSNNYDEFDEVDMDVEGGSNLGVPGDECLEILMGNSFGPEFKAILASLLNGLKKHAAVNDPTCKPKVFSHKAYVKMTGETKQSVAEIYNKLHEAIFHDRKITFKKPVQKAEMITLSADMPCTCSVLVQCVLKCPHNDARHTELLREAVSSEEQRLKAKGKVMAHKSVQTDRILSVTPKNVPSSSVSTGTTPSREASFSRGGTRGRGKTDFNFRGSFRGKRNRSRSFQVDNYDRSQASTSLAPERGRQQFKQPNQPAQNRLQEKRRKMEEPESRRQAEAVAAAAKAEADKISAQLNTRRRRHGESALDANGNVDLETCPLFKAPPGMKAHAIVENGLWKIILEPKD